MWLVGPLVDVVAGMELSFERLREDVDSPQPFDESDAVPVRDDQTERRPVIGASGSLFIS